MGLVVSTLQGSVAENVYSHHVARLKHDLRIADLPLTLDENFAYPFSRSVVHGLYSGEGDESFFTRFFRRSACAKLSKNIYRHLGRGRAWTDLAAETAREVFNVSYDLGRTLGEVPGLRNKNDILGLGELGHIELVTPEEGATLVRMMADEISLPVADMARFSKSIWLEYSRGVSPRLHL